VYFRWEVTDVANTKQCPNGHFYDPNTYQSCPHCMGNGQIKSSKTPWVITVIAVIVALLSFLSFLGARNDGDELAEVIQELTETRKKLKEAEDTLANNEKAIDQVEEQMKDALVKSHRYDELCKILGRGTDSYHSNIPVLVLKPGGSVGKIPVYCKMDTTVRYNIAYVGLSVDNEQFQKYGSSTLSAKWSGKWNNSWTDLEVTSGSGNGVYFFVFTNDANSDQFSILVIVDENYR